ncbi:MAG: membrane protein insertase YidC, partial [Rubrivivax sp.]
MTDMRRTLLWMVFATSLVLLWDGWQKHNGKPSMFGGTPRPAASAPATAGSTPAGVPTAGALPGAPVVAGAAAPATAASAPAASEVVEFTTDTVKASFDTLGGSLVRLELLSFRDSQDAKRNMVLFTRDGAKQYLARTGLAGTAGLNHQTLMRLVPGDRQMAAGANTLSVRFESPVVDGRQLVKTYTFTRGAYTVGVKHEVLNQGTAPFAPQLYLQLARDGAAPDGETSAFYSTFTGPALFTSTNKYQKVDFKDIEKGNAEHDKTSNDGWVAIVQHYFASAWLVTKDSPRVFRTAKDGNLFVIDMTVGMGEAAPGASVAHEAVLFAGPQEEKKLASLAPGMEYLKDYGWLMPLSKPLFWLLDQLHRILGNWGWSIVALVVLLKIAFYWLNASAYRSMAKMKAINPRVMELRERLKDKP